MLTRLIGSPRVLRHTLPNRLGSRRADVHRHHWEVRPHILARGLYGRQSGHCRDADEERRESVAQLVQECELHDHVVGQYIFTTICTSTDTQYQSSSIDIGCSVL
jgi:hypothetical protein